MRDISAKDDVVKSGEKLSREIARNHYENFTVSSFFISSRLRQDHFNIYAFCRLADDFSDETVDKSQASASLDHWETLLEIAACETVTDPLFAALGDTIRRRRLSIQPFRDLLAAFRHDLNIKRYQTWDELREYTRLSADPVGRIILELHDQKDPDYFALSDKICTALQLANHWQDVREDYLRGRIYLPLEDLRRFEVSEDTIAERRFSPHFRELMLFEIQRARRYFEEGKQLLSLVPFPLKCQLALYWYGGVSALNAILRVQTDVLNHSAKLNTFDKAKILAKSVRHVF